MKKSYTCSQMRALDRAAVERYAIPSLILMENAGRSLVESLCRAVGSKIEETKFLICCGKGNNGGDGFVMARRLLLSGCRVETIMLADPAEYKGDAAVNQNILSKFVSNRNALWQYENFQASGERLKKALKNADWIVDALLGTGAANGLRDPYSLFVSYINKSGKPVFSVDIPTGINGDTGLVYDEAVHAKVTCTLAGMKIGLLSENAKTFVGNLELGDIGVPIEIMEFDEIGQ